MVRSRPKTQKIAAFPSWRTVYASLNRSSKFYWHVTESSRRVSLRTQRIRRVRRPLIYRVLRRQRPSRQVGASVAVNPVMTSTIGNYCRRSEWMKRPTANPRHAVAVASIFRVTTMIPFGIRSLISRESSRRSVSFGCIRFSVSIAISPRGHRCLPEFRHPPSDHDCRR